jgi:DNA-binding response OmpR family regulator
MKVLIADDDRVITLLLSTRFKRLGFEVIIAHDAMQAMMLARRCRPDVIILDINMPGGSGMEVLRRLKNSTNTDFVPVIVLSGSGTYQEQTEVMNLGATAFVYKHSAIDRAEAMVESCFELSQRRRSA